MNRRLLEVTRPLAATFRETGGRRTFNVGETLWAEDPVLLENGQAIFAQDNTDFQARLQDFRDSTRPTTSAAATPSASQRP